MLNIQDKLRLMSGKLFIIATDFDDTLVHTDTYPVIGEPTSWFYQLKELQHKFSNLKVILWTCRDGQDLEAAVDFCFQNGLVLNAVNEDVKSSLRWKNRTPKPFAHIYVDDRAVSFNGCEIEDKKLNNIFESIKILKELS